jgi:hypothetical protein
MYTLFRKHHKWLAILLGVLLITEIFLISLRAIGEDGSVAGAKANDDQRIASDLSNMTGVAADQILNMRTSGDSWNTIIDTLKVDTDGELQPGRENRSLLLMHTGLEEEAVQRLLSEGYTEQKITDVKLLAERVQSQLHELVQSNASLIDDPFNDDPGQDAFRRVAESFNVETAVQYMLKLKDDFGGMELVLDEYLCALQLGMHLEAYAADQEQYTRDKELKRLEHIDEPIVTQAEIERVLLEHIQRDNSAKREKLSVIEIPSKSQHALSGEPDSPLPDIPSPSARDIKPDNPAQAILNELERINPNHPNPL